MFLKKFTSYSRLMPALALVALASCGSSETDPDYPELLYATERSFEFEAEGGYQTLYLISENIPWSAMSAAGWLEVTPASGASTTPIKIVAAPNGAGTSRTDTIRISSTLSSYPCEIAVKVTQKGK